MVSALLPIQQEDIFTEAQLKVCWDHFMAFGGTLTAETMSSKVSIKMFIYWLKYYYVVGLNDTTLYMQL
jgi:hypothetical protein